MTAKEIQNNKDGDAMNEEAVLNVKVPATGLDVSEIIGETDAAETTPAATESASTDAASSDAAPESAAAPVPRVPGKVTPGRKLRDSARKGGRGGAGMGAGGGRGSGRGAGRRGGGDNRERVKPEFDSKIIDIRRVTRVTSGGRRMNFSVAVVAGDKKGRVGVGLGKGIDTAGAVEKATREAKKNLIKVPLSAQMTIPHAVEAKYGSAIIMIFPARGRGVVAGSSARAVIELAGIKDVCAKFLSGSKNRVNNAKVAVEALKKLIKIPRATYHGKK